MRNISVVAVLLLTACANAPQYTYQSPHDQIVQQCTDAGYTDKELDDCVESATKAYVKEFNKREKEEAKEAELRKKKLEEQQREVEKQKLELENEKCTAFGFKKGSSMFTTCKAVNFCVKNIQSMAPDYLYQNFDAYVNPASGLVEYIGHPKAMFSFEKCMASKGAPLTKNHR